jgi:hypothetical protein
MDAIGASQGDGDFHSTLRRMEEIVEHVGGYLESWPSTPRNSYFIDFAD